VIRWLINRMDPLRLHRERHTDRAVARRLNGPRVIPPVNRQRIGGGW
jgi:hypothetical protein